MKNTEKLKVIVAGGGLVGLTAAIAFEKIGAEVIVCEQAPEIRAAGASIGLWKNALDVFVNLGMGEKMSSISTPIETWFFDASGHRFRADGYGVEDHSFQLFPRPMLNSVLAGEMGKEQIDLQARVIGFEEQDHGVKVVLENGKYLFADLLIGADGVYSKVRNQLLPDYPAQEHKGHHVWRALVPSADEPKGGTVLTVGHERTRGGYFQTHGNKTTWMVNQFDCDEITGSKKEEALKRAINMNDNGWGEPLIKIIERTPEESILHNQIMLVPPLPFWVSDRIALIGDAAHGLSPHISAGGTLGIEDVTVLINAIKTKDTIAEALKAYESKRIPYYEQVRKLALAVENAKNASEYAHEYAAFSHWMLNDGYRQSRT
jgi:2-polyprenyl-6-methoxyphenol hydroxylase-like FAD-dependent oxidoreductase